MIVAGNWLYRAAAAPSLAPRPAPRPGAGPSYCAAQGF